MTYHRRMAFTRRLNQTIARLHDDPAALRGPWALTAPACCAYAAVIAARNAACDVGLLPTTRVETTIVSVGNLTTGGTGKTPIVQSLAQQWDSQAQRVAILTRGYGARQPLAYGRPQSADHGDEAYCLQCALPQIPVLVGRDRARNAQRAVQDHQPDVLLLDDGFQYRRLARDVNLVLIDAPRLFGNGALLPTGPLREPLRAIQRADAIWLTKSPDAPSEDRLRALLRAAGVLLPPPIVWVPFEPAGLFRLEDDAPIATPVTSALSVCGLAHPADFERTLAALDARVRRSLRFSDHHAYDAADVRRIQEAMTPDDWLLISDKDAVKLAPLLPPSLRAVTAIARVRPLIPDAAFEVFAPALRPTSAGVWP